ncbi:hypothetical protein BIW11_14096, partial [Tropilaelaps mercedesae]
KCVSEKVWLVGDIVWSNRVRETLREYEHPANMNYINNVFVASTKKSLELISASTNSESLIGPVPEVIPPSVGRRLDGVCTIVPKIRSTRMAELWASVLRIGYLLIYFMISDCTIRWPDTMINAP